MELAAFKLTGDKAQYTLVGYHTDEILSPHISIISSPAQLLLAADRFEQCSHTTVSQVDKALTNKLPTFQTRKFVSV